MICWEPLTNRKKNAPHPKFCRQSEKSRISSQVTAHHRVALSGFTALRVSIATPARWNSTRLALQALGPLHPYAVEQVAKGLARVPVQELGKVLPGDMAVVRPPCRVSFSGYSLRRAATMARPSRSGILLRRIPAAIFGCGFRLGEGHPHTRRPCPPPSASATAGH